MNMHQYVPCSGDNSWYNKKILFIQKLDGDDIVQSEKCCVSIKNI